MYTLNKTKACQKRGVISVSIILLLFVKYEKDYNLQFYIWYLDNGFVEGKKLGFALETNTHSASSISGQESGQNSAFQFGRAGRPEAITYLWKVQKLM